MGRLKVLPASISNMIAAGEVVQRPASVVKELMENAVDAGATHIDVVITDSGRTLIQVIDNGTGMSPSDAVLCFERHATSKIATAADLEKIMTYGFRGEALASIAAVSEVTLRTRRHSDETATQVTVKGGEVKTSSVSAPEGSNFAVRNLFYNTPARRKFLKSDNVEFKHIVEEFTRVAIPRHAGDLCIAEGKVYVSVILYNKKMAKRAGGTGWIYICDTDLKFLRKVAIPDTPRPDGIAFSNGSFYVAGDDFGKAPHPVNTISVYDKNFKFEKKLTVDIGKPTRYGAQTLNAVDGRILAGFYASKGNSVFLELPELKTVGTFPLSVNVGMAPVPKKLAGERELYLIARITGKKNDMGGKVLVRERRGGKLVPAEL